MRKRRAAFVLRQYGVPKVAIAYALGVSRKTVDAWLKQVNPEETVQY